MSGGGNVATMWSGPAGLSPRARALLDQVTHAGGVAPNLGQSYLVKGWLQRATLSVVYGPSNVGKSFLAVDLAHHIASGRPWAGRRVAKSRVLYIAAEAGGTFTNRVAGLHDPEFWILPVPVTLIGKSSDAAPLTDMVAHLAETGGAPFGLIIVDTMARVMGGADENAAPDIAELIENLDHRAVVADKGYDSDANRALARSRGAVPVIPHRSNRKLIPARFARALYRGRARIEQAVGKLKRFKRIALRCDKTARNFRSFVALAAALISMKSVHSA